LPRLLDIGINFHLTERDMPERSRSLARILAGGILSGILLPASTFSQNNAVPRKPAPATVDSRAEKAKTASRFSGDRKRPTTLILVDLITGDEGVGLRAQRWTQVFEKLDVTLTIRRELPNDKPGVVDKKSGDTFRQVQVTGRLDPRGRIVFGDRAYSESDVEKLTEWLNELREFGAQGSPDGKPVWGLTRQQFSALHEVLTQPLTAELTERPLPDSLKLLELPEDLPIRFSVAANERLKAQDRPPEVRQSLKGLSRGTSLAIALAEQGLGFHPRRLADGSIELAVAPLSELKDAWPVGWAREQSGPATAPRLFAFVPVEVEELELDAVLILASQAINVPIFVDTWALDAKKVDLASVKVSHPAKRTTWSLALGAMLFKAKTKFELLIDERGRPFLWVTPVDVPRRPQKD
jgi:hypothetical protein